MKKNILFVFFISFNLLFAYNSDPIFEIEINTLDHELVIEGLFAIYEVDQTHISTEIANETITYCEEAITEICEFFDLNEHNYHNKFRYYLYGPSEGLASWESDGEVTIYDVEDGKSAYYHETVHAVLGNSSHLWTREGIAEYLDDKFSKHQLTNKRGRSLNEIAKTYLLKGDEYRDSLKLIFDDEDVIDNPTKVTIQSYYLYSATFVGYLLTIISPEEFLDIYYSQNFLSDIKKVTGFTLNDLKYKWMKYIGLNIFQRLYLRII